MRNLTIAVICVVVVGVVAGDVFAIGAGPSGRIYLAGRFDNGTRYMRLQSYEIGTDWNIVGSMQTHGDIVDNCFGGDNVQGNRVKWGLSPNVSVYGGTGYGKIVVGLWYDNDPASEYTSATVETMDVLEITAKDGGIATIDLLTDGAASTSGAYCTEGGLLAMPDPAGQFTGGPDRYIVNAGARFVNKLYICTDTESDGDIADDAADYVESFPPSGNTWNGWGDGNDWEILGKKLMRGPGRYTNYIEVIDHYDNGEYGAIRRWAQGADPQVRPLSDGGFAAGVTKDGHEAVWSGACLGAYGNYSLLGLFIDLNNDGDALDNADVTGTVDEYRIIYDANSAPGTWNNPVLGWRDIEWIDTGDNQFLLVNTGSALFVMQLADNGEFMGTGQGANAGNYVHLITSGSFLNEMEFDSQLLVSDIPEPGMMMVMGTSALGLIGYLRRRRMR